MLLIESAEEFAAVNVSSTNLHKACRSLRVRRVHNI